MMGYGRGYSGGWSNMMGGGWFGDLLVLLFGALILAGIVLLVIWAVRSSSGREADKHRSSAMSSTAHDEAIAVARGRLASGEITQEQYSEIMNALGS